MESGKHRLLSITVILKAGGFPVSENAVIRPLRTATRRSWQPGGFGDSCLPEGIFHGALDYSFVEVMPTPNAGLAVDIHHEEARSRELVGVE
jgi:hypothetical protein